MKPILSIPPGLAWLLMLAVLMGCMVPAMADTPSPETRKKIEFVPPAENPDELFKEAAALAEKNPDEAVRLYQRAFQSKPEVWEDRRKMALLFERLGKPDAAATEFESINNAVNSAQSHADLARSLEKTGSLPAAAAVAFHGAQKFPEDDALAVSAGELLLNSGQVDRAAEFLEKSAQRKSGDKKILFLLAQALEQ